MNFRVKWEIDIEADSPLEAAQQALEIQRDPESTATVFEVGGSARPFVSQVQIDFMRDIDETGNCRHVSLRESFNIWTCMACGDKFSASELSKEKLAEFCRDRFGNSIWK